MSVIKKIFFVSLLVLVLTGLFWGVYNLSFSKPKAETPKETTAPEPILTSKETPRIMAISSEAVLAPVLTSEGNTIKYYAKSNGKVYEIDLDGLNKQTVNDTGLMGLSDVFWSPDASQVITKFSKPENQVQFFYYNYTNNKGVPLKSNLDEVSWQTSGSKIFYKYFEPKSKERTLNVSDPDGNNWKKLADLSYRNLAIAQIPRTSLVSFWNKPDAFTATDFESIPIIGGEKKKIFSDRFGADYLWDSSGSWTLVSHTDAKGGSKMQLAVINYNGGEYRNLDFPTFVSKCAWSSDSQSIYCALPGGISDKAILPNDYNDGKFFTTDTFWKINVVTGEKSRIVETNEILEKYDASTIFLNADESSLFFVNKIDGKIYRISL
jgi:hypothetical protein